VKIVRQGIVGSGSDGATDAAGSGATFPQQEVQQEVTKPRLRRAEASAYLEQRYGLIVAPSTLAKYVTTGGGPPFHKAGRTPLYPTAELDLWATKRLGPLLPSTSAVRQHPASLISPKTKANNCAAAKPPDTHSVGAAPPQPTSHDHDPPKASSRRIP
jgi:hypothetical protein